MKTSGGPNRGGIEKTSEHLLRGLLSYFFDAERQLFVSDAPFPGGGAGLIENELVAERFALDVVGIPLHHAVKRPAPARIYADAVEHLEAGVLAHRLDLGDDFAHIAFLDERRREIGIEHDGDPMVG